MWRQMCNKRSLAGMNFLFIIWQFAFLLSIFRTVHLLPNNSSLNTEPSSSLVILCEESWILYGQHCYKLFGSLKSFTLSWRNASNHCTKYGGHLASIHSREQHDFLAFRVLIPAETNAWIGLHDGNLNGIYAWDDTSKVNFTYWTPGRPLIAQNNLAEKTGCTEMRLGKRFNDYPAEWYDVPCSQLKPFICQIKRNETFKLSGHYFCTEKGWPFKRSCYNLVVNKLSWDTAEHFCKENFGGHLVTISNLETDRYLSYVLPKFHQSMWIGMKLRNELQQKWTSGWNVAYQPYDFQTAFTDGLCVLKHYGIPPYWSAVPCHETHPFICETSKTHPPKLKHSLKGWSCPNSSKEWRDLGGEFCYYFDTRSHKTYHEAHNECQRRGGLLASKYSKEESEILHPFVRQTQLSLYIGLNSLHTEDHSKDVSYKWADGSSLNYTHWEKDRPSSSKEKCVEILTRNMKWSDVSCEERRGFICSAKKVHSHEHKGGQKSNYDQHCQGSVSFKTLIGPICFGILLLVLVAALIYFLRPWLEEKRRNFTSCIGGTPTTNDRVHLLSERPM